MEAVVPREERGWVHMTMPNFLIIGAAKAGTSSLYYYLKQHPQVFMTKIKEPKFFALEGEEIVYRGPAAEAAIRVSVNKLGDYQQMFEAVSGEIAIGEASALYLSSPRAAERIRHHVPDAKLVVVLRNPVSRAFSSYSHLVREGLETLDFAGGLAEETSRMEKGWLPLFFYRDLGFYHRQLERYFSRFDRSQIKLYLFEELREDSQRVVTDLCRFLGVDPDFTPDLTKMNVSGVPRNRVLHYLLNRQNPVRSALRAVVPSRFRRRLSDPVRSMNLGPKPAFPPEIRGELIEVYREDILRLQDLIERDLTPWLKIPEIPADTP